MKMTLQDPEEIKIFILYLLDRIGYPLSYTDIGTIVIRDGIIDYFAFCEYFDELLNAGHIAEADENGEPILHEKDVSAKDLDTGTGGKLPDGETDAAKAEEKSREKKQISSDPDKKYVVTKTGRLIADSLSENILMAAVREKSYMSAMRHLSLEKRGAVVDQTFERDGKGFIFHCSIKDKDGLAMQLSLRADTVYQLNKMRINFDEKPDVVLRGMVALLTGNVNYLFEN